MELEYRIYATFLKATNDFGVGERTETVSAQTMGSAPISPATTTQLIKVNSSSIVLNLRAWLDGGCPITSFVVEYQKIRSASKTTETENTSNVDEALADEVTISVDDHLYSGKYMSYCSMIHILEIH